MPIPPKSSTPSGPYFSMPDRAKEEAEERTRQEWTPEYDTSLGLHRQVRRNRAPELHNGIGWIPTEILNTDKPPPQVAAWCEELIGKEPEYIVRLHPIFRRWCLFQRYHFTDRKTGKALGRAYKLVSLFEEQARDGHLPADYQGEPHLQHLRGRVGDFRLPHRRDFEIIRRVADMRNQSADEVNEKLEEPITARERAIESERESRIHDFNSYYWNAARSDANEGQKMQSTLLDPEGPAPIQKWVEVQRDGFTIRAKVGSPLALELETEEAAKKAQEEQKARLERDAMDKRIGDLLTRYEARQALRKQPRAARTM